MCSQATHIHHNLNTDGELHYHKQNEVSEAYFSEVLFAIIPSVPVSLILNLPFPTLPAAGLEAVQGQKHRSNSLVHNNTAASKEEQRSSCSNPNSWRCKKHRLTRALTSTTWFSVAQHNSLQNSVKLQFQYIHLEAGVLLFWIMPAHCLCPTCELCHVDSIDKLSWSTFPQVTHKLA